MTELRASPRDADGLLRAMLDVVDAGCLAVDEAGEIVAWNDAFAERLGYGGDEPPSLSLEDVVGAGDRDAVLEGEEPAKIDLVTADGDRIAHELRWETHVDEDSGERLRVGVARDVTDRQERQRELERQWELFRGMVNTIPDVVFAFDADGEPLLEELLLDEFAGYSRADLLELHPAELIAEEARPGMEAAIAEAWAEGGVVSREAPLVTKDGERVPYEFRATRFELDGEVLGIVGTGRDISERVAREREVEQQRAFRESMVTAIPDVVFAFDETGEALDEEFLIREFGGYDREELRGKDPIEVIAPEARGEIAAAIDELLAEGGVVSRQAPLLTKDGERIPYEFRVTRFEFDGEVLGFVGSARDVSERVERERALERQRDELATLAEMAELILEITRELLETPSRRDVERIVCQRLADAEHYAFAWIGERAVDEEEFVPRVSADADEDYVAAAAGHPDGERAWRTGEVQVATVDDEPLARWQEAAAERGVEAAATIPLQHGGTVYGLLGVHATSPDAFTDRKVEALRVLGETVGFVTNAIKRRRLLFAESVTDLDLSLGAESSVIARLAATLEGDVSLEGYVDLDERWVCYLDVEDAPADAVVDVLAGDPAVRSARVVADETDRRRVEVDLTDAALFDAADAVGATVRAASATAETARATLEVPVEADVRETVDLLAETLPAASLVAKRERDRRPAGPGTPDTLLETLTDRQREALTVAVQAGYYQWPRESTAEEVARTLDISTATLHGHLRKAEGALLSGLLGEE